MALFYDCPTLFTNLNCAASSMLIVHHLNIAMFPVPTTSSIFSKTNSMSTDIKQCIVELNPTLESKCFSGVKVNDMYRFRT